MEKIVWNDKYKIGVETVDQAHAKLFRVISKLQAASEDSSSGIHTYREGIKYLEAYTMTHFSEEEAYMRSIRYNGYGYHKRIHDTFRDKTLTSLKSSLEMSNFSTAMVRRFLGIMGSWLTEHIMREDQAIVGKAVSRKEHDISSQVPVIFNAVNRIMGKIFQVEADLADVDYKGQSIGEGIYCRQTYPIEGGIRLQLLLGMEDALLLRGYNLLTGQQSIREEEKQEAALRVFEPLFESMGRLFQASPGGELDKKNLMTTNAFRTDFMKGYFCRLLFSSKLGYFVFCYRSWRVSA